MGFIDLSFVSVATHVLYVVCFYGKLFGCEMTSSHSRIKVIRPMYSIHRHLTYQSTITHNITSISYSDTTWSTSRECVTQYTTNTMGKIQTWRPVLLCM